MTVKELKEILENFEEEDVVCFIDPVNDMTYSINEVLEGSLHLEDQKSKEDYETFIRDFEGAEVVNCTLLKH